MRFRNLFFLLVLLLPGAATALAQSSLAGSQPGLAVSVSNVYYSIRGNTASDLSAQMDALGPVDRATGRRYAAFTNWALTSSISDRESAGGCRMTSARVLVDLTYTYPRWSPPPDASAALVRNWNRYLQALHRHQRGHGAIAVQAGRTMLESIRALKPRRSCRELKAAADRLAANATAQANEAEAAYDARTNRGANQGVYFP